MAVGAAPKLIDIWEQPHRDDTLSAALDPHVTRRFGEVNIFHLNGDEVEKAVEHLGGLPADARNIVMPMWELPRYPSEWARQLNRFDEVWAASSFMADALADAVTVPVAHVPVATEIQLKTLRGRRYFGIRESAYAFLFFFDLRSHIARKNPGAVVMAFRRLLKMRPWADTILVLKVHGAANAPQAALELAKGVNDLRERVMLVDVLMDEDDVHNLIRCCDAFVSLHRAEGIGLGLAEAMWLARPTIGTAYSGNLDFMTPDTSRLVDYRLVSVPPGAYPHWQDQVWAEPDIEQAAQEMQELFDDPTGGRELGQRASRHVRINLSYRAAGLRFLKQLAQPAQPWVARAHRQTQERPTTERSARPSARKEAVSLHDAEPS